MKTLIKLKNKLYRFFRFFIKVKKKGFYNLVNLHNSNDYLSKLCEKYGTDKGFFDKKGAHPICHGYSGYYNQIFHHSREKVKLVFECGIGTNNPGAISTMSSKGTPGASLRVWRKYFSNALIYGADVDKKILFTEKRIKTFYVDQLKVKTIKTMWKKIGRKNFDLIIDDGLHTFHAGINLFENSINFLEKNGHYFIEDVNYRDLNKYFEYFYNKKKYIVNYLMFTLNPKVAGDSAIINIQYKNRS